MTGDAGDIGDHVVAVLRREGIRVVVLDDLSTGRAERLPLDVPLVRGRVGDGRVLRSVLPGAAGVVHLAVLTSAPESVRDPLAYYRANVTDTATLLSAMAEAGVPRLGQLVGALLLVAGLVVLARQSSTATPDPVPEPFRRRSGGRPMVIS